MRAILKLILVCTFVPFLNACQNPSSAEQLQAGHGAKKNSSIKTDSKAESTAGCKSLDGTGYKLHYCVSDPKNQLSSDNDNINVVYMFFNIGDKINSFDKSKAFANIQARLKDLTPVFIALSLDNSNFVTTQADEIVKKLIPQIEEAEIGDDFKVSRQLSGFEIGGHNALRLLAVDPPFFMGASAICPTIVNFDPYDSTQVAAFVSRNTQNNLNTNKLNELLNLIKASTPTSDAWKANNPFEFAKNGRFAKSPIFLSISEKDSVGLPEGEIALADVLKDNEELWYYNQDTGYNACDYDDKKLAKFMRSNLVSDKPASTDSSQQ